MTTTHGTPQEILDLEPQRVWQLFAGMAATPRESKKEGPIRAHMRELAAQHGLTAREDAVGNMVIEAPASAGCENAPLTVLQGHVDMVCEKNAGTEFNFDTDGIRMLLDKEAKTNEPIVRADGTTLGADNGIGVVMAFAAATDPSIKRPPLELLLTVDEEAGMTGAKALASDFFKGRRLINLDSEEDDAIYMGCAGGTDTTLTWNFKLTPIAAGEQQARITISGLRGGHSGGDVHENRGNANKILARVLNAAGDGLRLVAFRGGSKRNAIPREGEVVVAGPAAMITALEKAAATVRDKVAAESYEAGVKIGVEPTSGEFQTAATAAETRRFTQALVGLPCGVLGMHPKVPGLVQTSNNIGTIVCERGDGPALRVVVGTLARSSSQSLLHVTRDQIEAVGRLGGADVQSGNEYPGWEPNVDSPLLATCRDIYEKLFGKTPHVAAIHAGLECGLIGERVGGKIDMVSFGPRIEGAHSPDERTYPDSVAKSWKYLVAVLAELAEG